MEQKCTKCGLCLKACASLDPAITMGENGPEFDLSKCSRCGHCIAVCPTDAIAHPSLGRAPLAGEPLSPEDGERFLRYPRSIRYFKDEPVDREKMKKLLTAGTYAFTGSNRQGVSYIVASGRDKRAEILDLFCTEAERFCPENPSIAWLMPRVERYRKTGEDGILRGAPELILAISKNDKDHRKNAYFSSTFIALYAPTVGLGICWAGMFETLACNPDYDAAFRKYFGVPEGYTINACLMAGVPDIKFRRFAERDPLSVTFID